MGWGLLRVLRGPEQVMEIVTGECVVVAGDPETVMAGNNIAHARPEFDAVLQAVPGDNPTRPKYILAGLDAVDAARAQRDDAVAGHEHVLALVARVGEQHVGGQLALEQLVAHRNAEALRGLVLSQGHDNAPVEEPVVVAAGKHVAAQHLLLTEENVLDDHLAHALIAGRVHVHGIRQLARKPVVELDVQGVLADDTRGVRPYKVRVLGKNLCVGGAGVRARVQRDQGRDGRTLARAVGVLYDDHLSAEGLDDPHAVQPAVLAPPDKRVPADEVLDVARIAAVDGRDGRRGRRADAGVLGIEQVRHLALRVHARRAGVQQQRHAALGLQVPALRSLVLGEGAPRLDGAAPG
eukprot:m.94212 g.94212  ORF g.94212 m.94212 type:complete len:351 (-) comp8563_c0_seq1:4702-5754(-)